MAELDESANGVYVIAVTPFTATGAVDFDSVDRMVDFYLSAGASGLTVLGMMGEAPKLTFAESRSFVQRVMRRVKDAVPVVVGVSSPGFAAMGELANAAVEDGAAGVMVAPPPTIRTDSQIANYFGQVAAVLGKIPFVLQDFPLSTGVQIDPRVLVQIMRDLPTCVMLKHEDWPGLAKITALRAASATGEMRRISILSGNGGLFLPEELARGADGAMTGFAYPEMMVGVCAANRAGELDKARDLFDAYLPLIRYEQQQGLGLAVRKHILAKRGVIATPTLRKPGGQLGPLEIAEVERMIERQTQRLAELA
jgi:4-hydroxy-tetrahydrodipicolinate synthase